MPIVDNLIKRAIGHETVNFKLAHATEVMLRRVLSELGLNIKPDTTAKQIQRQMTLAGIMVRHVIDKPGEPLRKDIPSGFYFYRQSRLDPKRHDLVHILFEPYMEGGEVIIKQGRVS